MKSLLFIAALVSTMAYATGKPHPTQSGSSSDAASNSVSESMSKSSADNVVSLSNGGGNDYRLYALPAPMYLPPLPAISSPCANSRQMGFSAGWSALSYTEGATSTDNCVVIEMYNAAIRMCNYKTAAQIMDLLTVKVLAGFVAPDRRDLIDLTPRECQALSLPVKTAPLSYNLIDDLMLATKKAEKEKAPEPQKTDAGKEPKKQPKKQPKQTVSAKLDDQCAKDDILACKIR